MNALFRKLNADIWAKAAEWVAPEEVDRIRSALLKLTRGYKSAYLYEIAEEALCYPNLIEFCYQAGLLMGYESPDDGESFTRQLHLIVDNTKGDC